jgi:predicted nucleic acid-binding protein
MPVVEVFLDSNVVLYALADEPSEQPKRDRVAEILATARFGISYQVLMETWVTATRKFERPVAEEKVLRFIEKLLEFPCVELRPRGNSKRRCCIPKT